MNPLIDAPYIQSFKEDATNTEAKRKLKEYALETFGVSLNAQKSFDNMIKELDTKLKDPKGYVANETDLGSGHTIDDILVASNTVDGVITNSDKEPDENLVKQIEGLNKSDEERPEEASKVPMDSSTKVVEDIVKTSNTTSIPDSIDNTLHRSDIDNHISEKSPPKVEEYSQEVKLPYDFNPVFSLLGAKPGYYTVPSWIYNWIMDTPSWKSQTNGLGPNYTSLLNSYLYYIKKDGRLLVKVDSEFKILK